MAWALYAIGWAVGWLLLWSTRRLPASTTTGRDGVAVVIPARDEATALPLLLRALRPQLRPGDELVVVDDHSSDGTTDAARQAGARVIPAPPLPAGWVGKPHACATGAAATTAPTLVFLDADVRPGPGLLDGLAGALAASPAEVVSVQPWHDAQRPGERLTALANVVTLMGCGGFTALGPLVATDVAFGPVLAVRRDVYEHVGGHARRDVRASLTEDIAIGRAVGRTDLYSARDDATFRMYPRGFGQSFAGWSRTMAAGIGSTRWWLLGGVAAWVTSLAGGPFAGWLAYPLSAIQVWVLGRRAGRVGPILAALYPVLVLVLVGVVGRAGWLRLRGTTTWKGREVRAA